MDSVRGKTKRILGAIWGGFSKEEQVLFEGDSEFGHIVVTEKKGRRLLAFGPLGHEHETAYNPANPDEPLFEYPGLMCAALALKADTRKLLLVGLGGGYLPSLLKRRRPDLHLTVVEIDPLVARVARDFFDFEAGGRLSLIIADGRKFLESRAGLYDQIWLDAYNGAYIPGPLMTAEFLGLCRERLRPGGVIVQNVHVENPLYEAHLSTMSHVFGSYYLGLGRRRSNAVLAALNTGEPLPPVPEAFARGLKKHSGRLGLINLKAEAGKFTLVAGAAPGPILEDRHYAENPF